jgi:hypothetical protein
MSTARRDHGIERRSFLKSATAVSTVLAAATNAVASEDTGPRVGPLSPLLPLDTDRVRQS